jgi:hypothetical protein
MSAIEDINTAMEAAVLAQECGDYATALRRTESAYMRICGMPDSEFDSESLKWSRDGLAKLMEYLQKKANQQAAANASIGGVGGSIIRPSLVTYKRG